MKTKIVLLVLIFNFSSCNSFFQLHSDNDLTELLENEIYRNQEKVDFTKITDFDWDELLIAAPYCDIKGYEKSLNVDLSNIRENGICSLDDFNLLVFIKEGKSIKISELPRTSGDFTDYKVLISKSKAIFFKDEKGLLKLSK